MKILLPFQMQSFLRYRKVIGFVCFFFLQVYVTFLTNGYHQHNHLDD